MGRLPVTADEARERLPLVDKLALLDTVRAKLNEELDAVSAAQRAAAQGATHEEAKPENDKDTRATEASYLARGQARRVEELSDELTRLATLRPKIIGVVNEVSVGALVALEDEDAATGEVDVLFVLPAAGGVHISVDDLTLKTVTPKSPLGKALIGRAVDDDVEVVVPRGKRQCVIVAVA